MKTRGQLASHLLTNTFDWRTSMTLKVFSAPSAILPATMMRRGANTMRAGTLPDLEIDVQRRHVTNDAVLVEVMIRGTHLGEWRGLPPTGRRVEVPLCGVYAFDSNDCLAGERIYYDRATVLRQLGVFHEPQSVLGQVCTLATHPVTIARALARKLLRR